ncbi:MAG: hypothetical protein E4H14_10180 [Candidatus Thorarchaeota archaeon]|nr:MAG: hypothetical protein E4H14_10180 [Candidatus Thorarchaeota archaeon]
MDRNEIIKYALPLIIAIALVTAIIILGMASQNPDGFEWSLFNFAGVDEPESGFDGIWAFLGDGAAIEAVTGIISILAILFIGYGFFWLFARKTE